MSKLPIKIEQFHKTIKNINFILLKKRFLTYSIIFILFALGLFFIIYMPYTATISKINIVDKSLYQLESSLKELQNLQKEVDKREENLNNILNSFKRQGILYSTKNRVISFNPGYIQFSEFLTLLNAIEETGFLKILSLQITNLNGDEKNIVSPNKYIYLKKLVIYSTSKVIK